MIDEYLDRDVQPEMITQATEEVDNLHPDITDPYYKQKLINLRVYQLVCLANQASADDLYTTKYKLYLKEYEQALKAAKANVAKTNNTPLFSIPITRG